MLKARSLAILALTATACYGFYTYGPLQKTLDMANSPPSQPASSNSDTIHPLVRLELVSIDAPNPETDVPKIHLLAHVENPSDTPIKILRWNSILDPQAGLLGAISLRNKQTSKDVDIPTIMINRVTPPPEEEYIRLAPHARMSNAITLALVATLLEDGAKYEARAEGRFMEVHQGDDQSSNPESPFYSCEPVIFTA